MFDRIHGAEHPDRARYDIAMQLFDSPLWELLTIRNVPLSKCREIANSLTKALGLTRITRDESSSLRAIVSDPQILMGIGLSRPDDENLRQFHDADDLAVIALLSALYKIAIANHELARAIALKETAERCAILFLVRWRPPKFLESLFLRLLSDRIFGNAWLTEDDWSSEVGIKLGGCSQKQSEARRRREIHDFVNWYISDHRRAGMPHTEDFGLPLVLTPVLHWTRNNREVLEGRLAEIEKDRWKAAVFEISPFVEEREDAVRIRLAVRHARQSANKFLRDLIAVDNNNARSQEHLSATPVVKSVPILDSGTPPKSVTEVLERMDLEDKEIADRHRERRRAAHHRAADQINQQAAAPSRRQRLPRTE